MIYFQTTPLLHLEIISFERRGEKGVGRGWWWCGGGVAGWGVGGGGGGRVETEKEGEEIVAYTEFCSFASL